MPVLTACVSCRIPKEDVAADLVGPNVAFHHGRFTILNPPGAANVANFATTVAFGINDEGQVVGQYVDAASVLRGYLWQPGRGFTTVNPPKITSFNNGTPGAGTIAVDINDRGQILLPAPGILFKGRSVPFSS